MVAATAYLHKRRTYTMIAVMALAVVAVVVNWNFHINRASYFDGRYNTIFIYSLIVYKFFELLILAYLLFYRHKKYLANNHPAGMVVIKIKKQVKLFLFLIPQGNTIFGLIAFKLSGNVLYFLIFSAIALLTLFIINPNSLKVTSKA